MSDIRKNTAGQIVKAQLVAVADGEDVTTGTTTVYVTAATGSQTAGSGTVAHEGNGVWSYIPTQAETNHDAVSYTWVNTAAVTVTKDYFPITLSDYKATGFSTHDAAAVVSALGTGSGLTALATAANLATVDTVVDAIKAKTDNLPTDPADQSLIIAATDAIAALIGTPAVDLATDVAAVKADTAATLLDTGTDGVVLSSATQDAIATAILDLANGVETGETLRQALRLIRAVAVGKAAGLGTTTATFRDKADLKDRITATVDADGNRTAVTTDAT